MYPLLTFSKVNHCVIKLVMHVYPLVFITASTVRSAINLYRALSAWSIAIRDKEFLVEMRLRNHEPEAGEADEAVAEGGDKPLDMDAVMNADGLVLLVPGEQLED